MQSKIIEEPPPGDQVGVRFFGGEIVEAWNSLDPIQQQNYTREF
jgi:hypothetical protein